MQHLQTRCPAHIQVLTEPSRFCGYVARATDTNTGRSAEIWAQDELAARQRAEALLTLAEAS